MGIYRVTITAKNEWFSGRRVTWTFLGTASKAEIAVRQAKRKAKHLGLRKVRIESAEYLGVKDFGR